MGARARARVRACVRVCVLLLLHNEARRSLAIVCPAATVAAFSASHIDPHICRRIGASTAAGDGPECRDAPGGGEDAVQGDQAGGFGKAVWSALGRRGRTGNVGGWAASEAPGLFLKRAMKTGKMRAWLGDKQHQPSRDRLDGSPRCCSSASFILRNCHPRNASSLLESILERCDEDGLWEVGLQEGRRRT